MSTMSNGRPTGSSGSVQRPIKRPLYPSAPPSIPARPASSGSDSELSHTTVDSNHSEGDDTPPGLLLQVVDFINTNKLANSKPLGANGKSGLPLTAAQKLSDAEQAKWVQPSGPRRPGEGIENEEQGVLSAEQTKTGGVLLRITLLAAGFVIGPSGTSVRDITRHTGADIKSWTESGTMKTKRPVRLFTVEGPTKSVISALHVVTSAVDRYKELCEGRCNGLQVSRIQRIAGVEFCYQPPPRNVVPFAAALKGQAPTRAKSLPDPVLMARQVQVLQQNPSTAAAAAAAAAGAAAAQNASDPLAALLAATQMASVQSQQPQQQQQQQQQQAPASADPRYAASAAHILATLLQNSAVAQAAAAAVTTLPALAAAVPQAPQHMEQPVAAMLPQSTPGMDQGAYIQQLQQLNNYLMAAITTAPPQHSSGAGNISSHTANKPPLAPHMSGALGTAAAMAASLPMSQAQQELAYGVQMQSAFAQAASAYNPFQEAAAAAAYQQMPTVSMWPYGGVDVQQLAPGGFMAAGGMVRQGSLGSQMPGAVANEHLNNMLYGSSDMQCGRDQQADMSALFGGELRIGDMMSQHAPLGVPGVVFESPRKTRQRLGAISTEDPIVKSPITAKAKSLLKQRRKVGQGEEGGDIDFGALSSMFGAAALGSPDERGSPN